MAEAPKQTQKETALDLVKRGLIETMGMRQEEADELPIDAVLDDRIGMDELDKVEFQMWIEEETGYSVELSDEEAELAKTVGDWVKLIEAKRK